MKKILIIIIQRIIIISPLLSILLTFHTFFDTHYFININSNNEKTIIYYFAKCGINLESNIKRIEYTHELNTINKFKIIYDNKQIQNIDIGRDKARELRKYIQEHGISSLEISTILLFISIILSIYTIAENS